MRKPGWKLNPSDKVVNAVLKRLEMNQGLCPCHTQGEKVSDRLCPCAEYRTKDICHCTLYVPEDESED